MLDIFNGKSEFEGWWMYQVCWWVLWEEEATTNFNNQWIGK